MKLTQEEKAFLLDILSKLQVSPADKNAGKIVEVVQSIVAKLSEVENG